MTRQDAEVLMLRREVARLRGQVAHWRAARESAIAGGDILKAEVERLRAENAGLLREVGQLKSQLLGIRMGFGEGTLMQNLSAAIRADEVMSDAARAALGAEK